MKITIKELNKTAGGVFCSVQIRGKLPTGKSARERYTREFLNVNAAREWAKERMFALIRGEDESGPNSPMLAKLWEEYKEKHVTSSRLKPSQRRALESLWDNHLKPVFGDMRIDKIDYSAVQGFKASRANKAPKTVNNALIALKAMLRFAIKIGKLKQLPPVEMLKVPKTIAQYYDVPTYNKLVASALELSDRHAAVVLLGGDAGLRAGEMIALDTADLALPLLTIKRNVWRGHEGTAKGNAERLLPLTARTVEVLRRLAPKDGGPVLRSSNKTRLNYTQLTRLLKQAQTRAGVPRLSLHKLRHTYGTDITRALGIRAAQALLGHAEVSTTERYAHVHAGPETAAALEAARRPIKLSRAGGGQRKTNSARAS